MKMSNADFNEQLRRRTKDFALKVIFLSNDLPRIESAKILARQLVRSATSVAANFRSACRGRSKAEFFSKICIVVEEADETQFWLEMLQDSNIVTDERISQLHNEISQILAITTTIKHKIQSQQ
ncbi:four helix bundle protein [Danxiaibacter flavus]|uniref:Four helix bundle protein n=1 Tax=Danxiaibacter flavus TaxID=3049108 RepID=A0ABV3ZL92_9BACT|nr:four helix bundle protein [Chitinophagaceae bacterium DXS]